MPVGERRRMVPRWLLWWFIPLLLAPPAVHAERLPIKTYTTADGLAHDRVMRIVRDSRGFLWFCTLEGLSRFDGYRFTTYGREHGLPHAITNDLVETRQGEYWVATDSGVCRFNPIARGQVSVARSSSSVAETQRTTDNGQRTTTQPLFTVYPVGDEPATNRVEVLYKDRAGRLWAGTDGGLFRLDETTGQFRRVEMRVPSRPDRLVGVWALVEDQEGSLWIATGSGLVRRLPDGRMAHYEVYCESLFQDREGRLWMGGYGDVVVFKPAPASISVAGERLPWRTLTHHRPNAGGPVRLPANPGEALRFTTADGLPRNLISGFYQSSDGRIWIVTHHGGLIEFDGYSFRRYTTAHGLSSNWLATLTEDRAGNLWVGTFVNGLMKIARRGFLSYLQADGLAYLRVLSIFEDQARQLCVISERGAFHRLDGRRFKAIRPGVPQQVVWDWYHIPFQDHTGEWWVPTEAGLYRFPRASRIEHLAHTQPKAHYTTRDGLTSNQVFSLFEDSQGDIWIGTSVDSRDRLTRWERSTQTFHRYTEADGLSPFNTPSAFCQDAAGNLWIGFWEGGLARYTAGRFTLLTTERLFRKSKGLSKGPFRSRSDRRSLHFCGRCRPFRNSLAPPWVIFFSLSNHKPTQGGTMKHGKRIPHSRYQQRLGPKLTGWLRRRSRPLPPEWLDAARLLLRINLDPLAADLDRLYSSSPRGRPPYDPICLLRALLLMLILRTQRIDLFARDLRRNPRLAQIAGFQPGQTPSTGTFYHFLDRLEDGPFQPACPHRLRPSQLRKQRRQRHLKQEKAERDAQRQHVLAQSDSLTEHLSDQLLAGSDSPRPTDLQQRLEDLLVKAAVIPSLRRGLLGDPNHLILAGDGSSLPSGSSPVGRPTCQCRKNGIYRCDCPRLYSDLTADWGWDSYHECYFFGHTYYQHLVSTSGHDLPVHLTIGPASETDFTLSLKSLDRFLKTCRDHQLALTVEAVAYDCGHDARGIYDYLLEKTIAPVITLNPRSGSAPSPTGTASEVNDHGVPLCRAGLPMRRHGTTPNHRILFHCPVKRPTHTDGAHAWKAHPSECPLAVLCQPDTKMGPVVYVRADSDPRFYPPIPRHTARFQQIMNLRSGCERSNSTKKIVHHLGHRPCRSATHFLVRLYLVSIIEHAKAWLAEDQKKLAEGWDQQAELSLITSLADAA